MPTRAATGLAIVLAVSSFARAQGPPSPPINLSASPVPPRGLALQWQNVAPSPVATVIEAGSASGLSDLAVVETAADVTSFQVGSVPDGTYYVRLRSRTSAGLSGPSVELVLAVVSGCLVPQPHQGLSALVAGGSVTLSWTLHPSATGVRLEAGSAPGEVDIFSGEIGLQSSLAATAPPGTYYVRVRSSNACGVGPPSNEVLVAVMVPEAPTAFSASTIGFVVTFQWNPPAGHAPAGYVLEAGSSPGQRDLASLPLGPGTTMFSVPGVPNGTYYVRVRAANTAAAGPPSNELRLVVGPPAPGAAIMTFSGLAGPNGAPFSSYLEAGVLVESVSGPWSVLGHGRPGPAIQIIRPAFDVAVTGEVRVTAGNMPFRLDSLDLYSSVTPIPYTLTGSFGGVVMFGATGTVPHTFGAFATVTNPFPSAVIDTLVISVTNPATLSCPSCSGNPVGIDNIVVRP
jgi:hypothetical protein